MPNRIQQNTPVFYQARIQGFTLIELIMVIVLLGIIGTATFSYIRFGATIFTQTVQRDQATAQSRFAIERLAREVRSALPRSVRARTDGTCLEFIPVIASSQYVSMPMPGLPESTPFIGVAPDTPNSLITPSEATQYLFVNATSESDIYGAGSMKRKELADALENFDAYTYEETGEEKTSEQLLVFQIKDPDETFPNHSPGRRYYVTGSPVSWCVVSAAGGEPGNLVRYAGYGFNNSLSNSHTMAEGVVNQSSEPAFQVNLPTLTRNNLVLIHLKFAINQNGKSEPLNIYHEVFLPNVP